MPRPRIYGYIAVLAGLSLMGLFVYSLVIAGGEQMRFSGIELHSVSNFTFFSIAVPIGLVSLAVIGTGFWIGWTILTIKVASPMPEIIDKKDFSKIKSFLDEKGKKGFIRKFLGL